MLDKNIIFKRKNMKVKNHLDMPNNTLEMRKESVTLKLKKDTSISISIYIYLFIPKLKKISEERLKTNE